MRISLKRWAALIAALALVGAYGARRRCTGSTEEAGGLRPGAQVGGLGIEILAGAGQFMSRLETDLLQSRRYAAVQTMSFEGDSAGRRLAVALAACPAPQRQLLIDSYSRFVVSDKFRFFPKHWSDRALRQEIDRTRAMLADLDARGVSMRLTNPMDPLLLRFMARNHKKMVVIDDRVAYLGGINFCDHNFEWRDMMIRIESGEVASFLRDDFLATWRGENRRGQREFGGVWLASLDGRCNDRSLAPIVRAIENARESIIVQSGYLTFPFIRTLKAARARGIRLVLLTPEMNNKPIVKDYLLWEATRAGFEIMLYPGRMSHLKAMLIDDSVLVAGSSNFDYLSYTVQQELVAVVTDPAAIECYRQRILGPDLAQSIPFAGRVSAAGGWPRFAAMRTVAAVSVGVIRVLDALTGVPLPQPGLEWYGKPRPLAKSTQQGIAAEPTRYGVSTRVQEW
ncbi:phosphatidylserine/phosphatidylglycerophosphate/cardiolipin synthase family protein [Candidatus Fermentibacteria bacterium]|nr:phosphatidylserine/phosphatidylglycerophosphate/cardiolipin synthase family protein [Candidatus Fermentibacteria bacterium]